MIDRVVRWHCTIDIIAITAGDAGVSSMGHGMHSTGSYVHRDMQTGHSKSGWVTSRGTVDVQWDLA